MLKILLVFLSNIIYRNALASHFYTCMYNITV